MYKIEAKGINKLLGETSETDNSTSSMILEPVYTGAQVWS